MKTSKISWVKVKKGLPPEVDHSGLSELCLAAVLDKITKNRTMMITKYMTDVGEWILQDHPDYVFDSNPKGNLKVTHWAIFEYIPK